MTSKRRRGQQKFGARRYSVSHIIYDQARRQILLRLNKDYLHNTRMRWRCVITNNNIVMTFGWQCLCVSITVCASIFLELCSCNECRGNNENHNISLFRTKTLRLKKVMFDLLMLHSEKNQ
jgi:hypothetical protein